MTEGASAGMTQGTGGNDPETGGGVNFLTRPNIWIPRVIGITAIATGFVLGIEGLNQPDSVWLPTALGLIVLGLCAQAYAFYRSILYKMASRENQDS